MRYIQNAQDEKCVMRCLLVIGQIGDVCGAIKHLVRGTVDLADNAPFRKAHILFLKSALGDAMLQLQFLANDLGVDRFELEELAVQRYKERKQEFAKAGKLDQWI